jgi:hypothetical protein
LRTPNWSSPPGQLCLLQRQLRDPGDDCAGRVRTVL